MKRSSGVSASSKAKWKKKQHNSHAPDAGNHRRRRRRHSPEFRRNHTNELVAPIWLQKLLLDAHYDEPAKCEQKRKYIYIYFFFLSLFRFLCVPPPPPLDRRLCFLLAIFAGVRPLMFGFVPHTHTVLPMTTTTTTTTTILNRDRREETCLPLNI